MRKMMTLVFLVTAVSLSPSVEADIIGQVGWSNRLHSENDEVFIMFSDRYGSCLEFHAGKGYEGVDQTFNMGSDFEGLVLSMTNGQSDYYDIVQYGQENNERTVTETDLGASGDDYEGYLISSIGIEFHVYQVYIDTFGYWEDWCSWKIQIHGNEEIPTPEPASLVALGTCSLGLFLAKRKKRQP